MKSNTKIINIFCVFAFACTGACISSPDEGESNDTKQASQDMQSNSGNNINDMNPISDDMSDDMDMLFDDLTSDLSEMGSTPKEDLGFPKDSGTDVCDVKCTLLDFISSPDTAKSRYNSETKILSFYLLTEGIVNSSLDASITSGNGSGSDVEINGTIDGSVIRFDISGVELSPSEYIELNNLVIELDCGERKALILSGNLNIGQDLPPEEIDCSNPFF